MARKAQRKFDNEQGKAFFAVLDQADDHRNWFKVPAAIAPLSFRCLYMMHMQSALRQSATQMFREDPMSTPTQATPIYNDHRYAP